MAGVGGTSVYVGKLLVGALAQTSLSAFWPISLGDNYPWLLWMGKMRL
jgi:hypothetical protein